MKRKYLTLDDLLLFCKKNNFNHFNAKEADGPIIVQTPGKFELSGDANIGLQPVKLVACHTSSWDNLKVPSTNEKLKDLKVTFLTLANMFNN